MKVELGGSLVSFSLFDTSALERGLDLCVLRNNVISQNTANANTPGYVAKTVLFEEQMRAFERTETGKTHEGPFVKSPTVVETSGKVDIVTEMAELAKNQILYSAYTTRLTKHFSDLEWIIQNAGR
jgi:flagellar basal-body rod protein FlgB